MPPLWCQHCLGDKSCDNLVVVMIRAGSSVLEYRVCVFEMMQLEIVKFLTLEMHCDPTSRNAHNTTALHLAAGNGHLDIVRFIISEQNCDPNIPGRYGGTPLHYAAEFGHLRQAGKDFYLRGPSSDEVHSNGRA